MVVKIKKYVIKCVIKQKIKFENCLETTQLENKINQPTNQPKKT